MTQLQQEIEALNKMTQGAPPPKWWWCKGPITWRVSEGLSGYTFVAQWRNHDGKHRFVSRLVNRIFLESAQLPMLTIIDTMMRDVEDTMRIDVDQFAAYLRSIERPAKCEWSITQERDMIDVTQFGQMSQVVPGIASVVLDIELIISHQDAQRLM